jgi:hypothetical protein
MTIKNTFTFFEDRDPEGDLDKKYDSEMLGLTKEQLLLRDLKDLAEEYIEIEKFKKNFIEIIRKDLKELDFSEFYGDEGFIIKENILNKVIKPANISGLNVVSVDGSSVVKKFMNVDFSFLKAICVRYYFYENHSSKIEYYPDLSGFNNYRVQGNYLNRDESTVDAYTSIDMKFMEIRLLNELIEKADNVDLIIIDGSIVLMPINLIFGKDLEISQKYDTLLREYRKLYSNCHEKGVILIGSIKDTRTSALIHSLRSGIQLLKPNMQHLTDFIKVNYRQVIDYFSDMDFYNRFLHKSERSCIFNCKNDIEKIRETSIKREIPYYFPYDFYAFYLKTAKYDTPCRIEYLMEEDDNLDEASKKADLISSIILPISSCNNHYGLPIPQIEAHKRAVFKPPELNILFNSLQRSLNKNGIKLIEKRRTRRPF